MWSKPNGLELMQQNANKMDKYKLLYAEDVRVKDTVELRRVWETKI